MRQLGVFHVYLHPLDVGVDVAVGHEDIRPAVVIVIKKETRKAEREQRSAADLRARRLVHKQSLSFVVVKRQHLIGEITNENAWGAGAIVIGGIHAHAGARDAVLAEGYAGEHAFFRESAVAIVAIELVRLRIVGKEKVGPAVIVEVK